MSIIQSRSGASAKVSKASCASTIRTRLTSNTALTAILEEKLMVDEYGFTDKTCKRCRTRLSIEEVLALVVPLDENGNIHGDVSAIDFDNTEYVCLNCYTDVIQKRTERKNQTSRLASADAVRSKADSNPAPASLDQPRNLHEPRASEVINKKTLDRLLVKKPASVIAKKSAPASVKASAQNRQFQGPVSAVAAYKMVKTQKEPAAKKPGPKKPKKAPINRHRTDISHFANAMFNGGVYTRTEKKSI